MTTEELKERKKLAYGVMTKSEFRRRVWWSFFHPRRSVLRYEECLDSLIEASKDK